MKRKPTGKVGRRIKLLTHCPGELEVSGPGAYYIGTCDVCSNKTQVAQWVASNARVVTLCQLCLD